MGSMFYVRLCVLLALLGLSGAEGWAGGVASAATTSKADLCRQDHYQEFLEAFAEDLEFQKQHTKVPLLSVKYEYDFPDAKKIETALDFPKIEFPVFPSAERRREKSLEIKFKPSAGGMSVQVSKPDTDYQITYFFERHQCWELVRMENVSL